MDRLALCIQLQAKQSTVTNADDIAGVGIDRTPGLQRARIKKVAYAKRTTGSRLFIHNTGNKHLLADRVYQLEVA